MVLIFTGKQHVRAERPGRCAGKRPQNEEEAQQAFRDVQRHRRARCWQFHRQGYDSSRGQNNQETKKTLRGRRRSCSKKMHNRPGSIPLHVCLAVFRGVAVYAYHMAKIVALGHSPSCAKCGQLDKYLRQDALCSKTTTCRECNDDR